MFGLNQRTLIAAGLGAILILLTLFRINMVNRLGDQGFFAKYLEMADQIVSGDVPVDRLNDVSPGYLWILAGLRAVHTDPVTIRSLQIAAVTLAALAIAFAGFQLGGWKAGMAGAILLLGNRAALVNATELEPETLILLLNALALVALAFGLGERARPRSLTLAGLLLGISAISRPTGALTVALLGVWLARTDWKRALKFVIASLLPAVIVAGINQAITGSAVIMDPGYVLYEGMNPLASGYSGVDPRIVKDIEARLQQPDALHIAYRIVASRAVGRPLSKAKANGYWTEKSLAFVQAYPGAALRLILRKTWLATNSHDAYDLSTLVRKERELRRHLWIPFGLLFALAVVGVATVERQWRAPLVLFALAGAFPLIAFYATARQRNALLPVLALLGGIGVSRLWALWHERRGLRPILLTTFVVATALLTSMRGSWQREDDHGWTATFRTQDAMAASRASYARGREQEALEWRALAATWRAGGIGSIPPDVLRRIHRSEITHVTDRSRLFDLALIALELGDAAIAEALLSRLAAGGYRPIRENRQTSSLSYFRGRAALLRGQKEQARQMFFRSLSEAPGDPNVLAANAMRSKGEAGARLAQLHDPFTVDLARIKALADFGQLEAASRLRSDLRRRFPEWDRPQR